MLFASTLWLEASKERYYGWWWSREHKAVWQRLGNIPFLISLVPPSLSHSLSLSLSLYLSLPPSLPLSLSSPRDKATQLWLEDEEKQGFCERGIGQIKRNHAVVISLSHLAPGWLAGAPPPCLLSVRSAPGWQWQEARCGQSIQSALTMPPARPGAPNFHQQRLRDRHGAEGRPLSSPPTTCRNKCSRSLCWRS